MIQPLDLIKASQQTSAAFLVLGGVFLRAVQDALAKLTSSELSLWQFQFFRGFFNILLLILFIRFVFGKQVPMPRRVWAVALRSLFLVSSMGFFYAGIPYLGLAEVSAGLYVFPLFVVILSYVVLGERVGPLRSVAVFVGFFGTLLVLKPGTSIFTPVALLPVGAGFFYACTLLTTRKLCRDESPITLVFGAALTCLIMGAIGLLYLNDEVLKVGSVDWPYLFTGWRTAEVWMYGVIALYSALNLISNVSLAKAYQSAESSWLVPFHYSYIIFATLWGFIIWRHMPDLLTFLGILLIAASGIFVALQQQGETSHGNTVS